MFHRHQLPELVDGLYVRENPGYDGFRVQTGNPWGCLVIVVRIKGGIVCDLTEAEKGEYISV